jgi:hypothetical protein
MKLLIKTSGGDLCRKPPKKIRLYAENALMKRAFNNLKKSKNIYKMAENENEAGTQPVENTPTQTLFRFVSLRSPQLSDENDQDKRFVLIPEALKTDDNFYIPVTTGSGSKQSLLREYSSLFAQNSDCITDLADFKNTYSIISQFAAWLARNKGTCTFEEFTLQRETVYTAIGYTTPDELILWNNLIYQVVTQKDFYIKEAVMQMLLAIHVLQNQANNEDEAKILLGARIVLPKELMLGEENYSLPQASRISEEPRETFPAEQMKKQQEISSAKRLLTQFESLKRSIYCGKAIQQGIQD